MGLRSAPGAFGVVSPLVWGRPAGSLQFPPEAWQRVQWAWQRWLSRHEGLARGLLRLSRISQRITIVLLVVAVLGGAAPGCCDGADALDAGLSGGDGAAVTHSHHLVAGGECHVLGECAVGTGGG